MSETRQWAKEQRTNSPNEDTEDGTDGDVGVYVAALEKRALRILNNKQTSKGVNNVRKSLARAIVGAREGQQQNMRDVRETGCGANVWVGQGPYMWIDLQAERIAPVPMSTPEESNQYEESVDQSEGGGGGEGGGGLSGVYHFDRPRRVEDKEWQSMGAAHQLRDMRKETIQVHNSIASHYKTLLTLVQQQSQNQSQSDVGMGARVGDNLLGHNGNNNPNKNSKVISSLCPSSAVAMFKQSPADNAWRDAIGLQQLYSDLDKQFVLGAIKKGACVVLCKQLGLLSTVHNLSSDLDSAMISFADKAQQGELGDADAVAVMMTTDVRLLHFRTLLEALNEANVAPKIYTHSHSHSKAKGNGNSKGQHLQTGRLSASAGK